MSTIPSCPVCGCSGETYELNGEPVGACQGDCQIILPLAEWTRLSEQQARVTELEADNARLREALEMVERYRKIGSREVILSRPEWGQVYRALRHSPNERCRACGWTGFVIEMEQLHCPTCGAETVDIRDGATTQ